MLCIDTLFTPGWRRSGTHPYNEYVLGGTDNRILMLSSLLVNIDFCIRVEAQENEVTTNTVFIAYGGC